MSNDWNPKQHKDKAKPQHEFDDREVPAGTYVVGGTWIDRPDGKKYVKLKFTVLHGPLKGAGFFTMMPINVKEKQGSANKVYHFLVAMGRDDVNIDFSNTNSIARAFLGGGFKCKVSLSSRQHNGKTYKDHNLAKFATRAQCSAEEKEVIAAWNEEQAAKHFGEDDSDAFSDDDDFGANDFEGADDFGDDDIPF